MIKSISVLIIFMLFSTSCIACYSNKLTVRKQEKSDERRLRVVEVNDPYYFRKNLVNNADLYIINVPVKFFAGTNITFSENSIIKKGSGFPMGNQPIFNIGNISNFSLEGGIVDGSGATDAILIGGGSHNISIKNVTVENAERFGIQVYGVGNKIKPHDIILSGINTSECKKGGIYINSANNITIENCKNSGGLRHIGIESPKPSSNNKTLSINQRYARNIKITRCISEKTTAFGIQLFYADYVHIEDCNIDGSKLKKGDKSCITVDRSNNIIIDKDTALNSPLHNIFITGSEQVSIRRGYYSSLNNTATQIHAIYNIEHQEDAVIKENKNLTIENNNLSGGKTGVLINGCIGVLIAGNSYTNSGKHDILIMEQSRSKDSVKMNTSGIVIKERLSPDRILVMQGLKNKVRFE